jgi:hypothetical protein
MCLGYIHSYGLNNNKISYSGGMPTLKFSAVIKIIGVNPYVLVSKTRAAKIKPGWRRPLRLPLYNNCLMRLEPCPPNASIDIDRNSHRKGIRHKVFDKCHHFISLFRNHIEYKLIMDLHNHKRSQSSL